MTGRDIAAEVDAFVREKYSIGPDDPDFGLDIHLFNYGYVDSCGVVELVSFLESEFSVSIQPRDFLEHPMNTISEISTFVSRRQAGEV